MSWYALYTRSQHEKVVGSMLVQKGFEVFIPLYTSIRRWKDRNKKLLLPLFPSYVFLHGGLDRRIDVLTTPGVCSFVGAAGPAEIAAPEINAIRQAVDAAPVRIEPHPFVNTGDRVRVVAGPFEGIEGILVRNKGMYRLVISVDTLGQSAALEIDTANVVHV
jgi:transcription antitermination factor NusG